MSELPAFRYHPDPVATGVVVCSDTVCLVCDRARGYIYLGPVFAEEEIVDELCPWCISDGSAAQRFDASFTDDHYPEDDGARIAQEVLETVTTRTPGYHAWQQEYWRYHCGDAAAFLGAVGFGDLLTRPEAAQAVCEDLHWTPRRLIDYVATVSAPDVPCAYLFRCLHCGTYLAHSDSD